MKRLLLIFLCLTVVFAYPLSVSASLPRIVDNADLLAVEEEAYLEDKAARLADTYQMDVVILTVDSLNGKSSEAYADDYFDENGYGIGTDYSGVLLLLSMEYRDWAISTCGETIYALTDYGIQDVFSAAAGYLSQDLYFEAFDAYLDALDPYFSAYVEGSPIDGYQNAYNGPGSFITGTQDDIVHYEDRATRTVGWYAGKFLTSLVIGAIVAGITLLIMRSRMNTARPQRDAASYVGNGSVQITQHRDRFLYSQVRKVRKQQNSSGGGGGSSIHRSASGRSHGGGHGKF